jgi:hypothetical protein
VGGDAKLTASTPCSWKWSSATALISTSRCAAAGGTCQAAAGQLCVGQGSARTWRHALAVAGPAGGGTWHLVARTAAGGHASAHAPRQTAKAATLTRTPAGPCHRTSAGTQHTATSRCAGGTEACRCVCAWQARHASPHAHHTVAPTPSSSLCATHLEYRAVCDVGVPAGHQVKLTSHGQRLLRVAGRDAAQQPCT